MDLEKIQNFLENNLSSLFSKTEEILSKLKEFGIRINGTETENEDVGYIKEEIDRVLRTDNKVYEKDAEELSDMFASVDYLGSSTTAESLLYEDFPYLVEIVYPTVLAFAKLTDPVIYDEIKEFLKSLTINKKEGAMSLIKELAVIKAGLSVIADDTDIATDTATPTSTDYDKQLPYEQMKRKPTDLDMGEYSLKPAEDLRRMAPLAKKLDAATDKINKLDEQITDMKTEFKTKLQEFMEKEGYDKAKQDLTQISDRASTAIQQEFKDISDAYNESKKILLEYKNTVYTVYDKITKKQVTDKDKLSMLMDAMTKLLQPDMVNQINSLVDLGVKQLETANTKIEKRFVSFPSQKDIRKKVKEELPKKTEMLETTANVWDSVKNFFSGLWQSIKNLFSPIKENAADLLTTLEDKVSPILDDVKSILGTEDGTGPLAMSSKY